MMIDDDDDALFSFCVCVLGGGTYRIRRNTRGFCLNYDTAKTPKRKKVLLLLFIYVWVLYTFYCIAYIHREIERDRERVKSRLSLSSDFHSGFLFQILCIFLLFSDGACLSLVSFSNPISWHPIFNSLHCCYCSSP